MIDYYQSEDALRLVHSAFFFEFSTAKTCYGGAVSLWPITARYKKTLPRRTVSLFGFFIFTKEHVADFTIISLYIDDQMLSKRFLVVFIQFQVQFFWLYCQFRRYRHLWAHESSQLVGNAERIYNTVGSAWFGFYVINLFPWEL